MESDLLERILSQLHRNAPMLDTSCFAVIGRLLRLAHLLERHREHLLLPYGLGLCSFDLLATLRRQGAPYQLTPTELYAALMLSTGSMTHRIDRLEREGWVVRVRVGGDRRSVNVQLTPQGVALVDRVLPQVMEQERQLLAPLSEADQQVLVQALRQVLNAIDVD